MNRNVRLRVAVLALIAGAALFMLYGCGGPPPIPAAGAMARVPSATERVSPPAAQPATQPPAQPPAPAECAPVVPSDSAAAIDERREGEEWTSIPLPDGTLFYVRYGEPGGVRIHSGPPQTRSAQQTRGAQVEPWSAAPSPAVTSPSAAARPTLAPAVPLAAQVRRILAEELAVLPAAPRYRVGIARPGLAPPTDSPAAPLPMPAPPPPGTAAVQPLAGARSVPDTLALLAPAREQSPPPVVDVFLPPPPGAVAETLRLAHPIEPRTVREAFTSEGLFTTQFLIFETGKSELLPISREILAVVAGVLREFPAARVRVEGHADHRGRAEANLELSRRRAEAVRDFLAGAGGLGPERLEAVGYGQERPVIEGSTPTALALNRRVQIRVLNPEALRRSVGDR